MSIEADRKKHFQILRSFLSYPALTGPECDSAQDAMLAIETLPQIVVQKVTKTTWEACVIDQPGAGHGTTWREALGDYVLNNPSLFGIKSTLKGVEGIKVLNKDGSPYRFKGEPSRED